MNEGLGFGIYLGGGSATGTVTSVGLAFASPENSIFVVSNSPVTGNGTLTVTIANQAANKVWAGPTTGAAAAPTFRSLVDADLSGTTVALLGANNAFTGSDSFAVTPEIDPAADVALDDISIIAFGNDPGFVYGGVPLRISFTAATSTCQFDAGDATSLLNFQCAAFSAGDNQQFQIDTNGLVTSYQGDTLFENGLVTVVGFTNRINQGSSIGTTTLYTTSSAYPVNTPGALRVSVYQQCITTGAAGTLSTTISWTDQVGATSATPASTLALTGTGRDSGSVFIGVSGSTTISFSTTLSGVIGSPKYNILIIVERLY